jgi:hypothetical protein
MALSIPELDSLGNKLGHLPTFMKKEQMSPLSL